MLNYINIDPRTGTPDVGYAIVTGGFEKLSGNCILQQGGHLILGNIREQRISSEEIRRLSL